MLWRRLWNFPFRLITVILFSTIIEDFETREEQNHIFEEIIQVKQNKL